MRKAGYQMNSVVSIGAALISLSKKEVEADMPVTRLLGARELTGVRGHKINLLDPG